MEGMRKRPHPFAWLLVAALVLAIAAAALAPDRAPAIALYWNPIYRAEIAFVVLALAYLLVIAGWMAYNGEAFRRIELPGGAALERDTQDLDAAAASIDDYQRDLGERLDAVEASLDDIIDRVAALEASSSDAEPGVR
jgi:hypothetical protein